MVVSFALQIAFEWLTPRALIFCQGPLPSHMQASPLGSSPPPAPESPPPSPSPNCVNFSKRKFWQRPRGKAAPSGRNKRWLCSFLVPVFLRREEAAGKRLEGGKEGGAGAQAALGAGQEEGAANSFAPSNKSSSSQTIPGNLLSPLSLIPTSSLPSPLFSKTHRQDIVINNEKGRKVPGRSYWEAQIKAGSFPGSRGSQGLVSGHWRKGQVRAVPGIALLARPVWPRT